MYEQPKPVHPKLPSLGTAYVVLGVIDLLWGLLAILGGIANIFMNPGAQGLDGAQMSEAYNAGQAAGQVVGIVLSAFALPVGAYTIYAGRKMGTGVGYTTAMIAVIANMVPCYNTCCCGLLGIPIGIWALTVLLDSEVKASFTES